MRNQRVLLCLLGLLMSVLALTGCPRPIERVKEANLSLLMAAQDVGTLKSNTLTAKARVVQMYELVSLNLVVDEISLHNANDNTDVVVLNEPFDLDLLTLLSASDLVDTATVPEGVYDQATLKLSSAMAEFINDPGNPVPVELLDGGILHVGTNFEAMADGEGLLLFDLGAITLIQLDAGGYQLIPDLQVGLFTAIESQVRGEIESVDPDLMHVTVERHHARIVVDVSQAVIFLPEDFDTPTGTFADLTKGTHIVAIGTLAVDGTLAAETVAILEREDDDDGEDDHGGAFHIRYQLENTEADPDATGEAKYSQEPNHRRLKVKVRDLTLVDAVLLLVDDEVIADAKVIKERAEISLESEDDKHNESDYIPEMTVDSVIEIMDADTGDILLYSTKGELDGHSDDHGNHDQNNDDDDDEHEDDHHGDGEHD